MYQKDLIPNRFIQDQSSTMEEEIEEDFWKPMDNETEDLLKRHEYSDAEEMIESEEENEIKDLEIEEGMELLETKETENNEAQLDVAFFECVNYLTSSSEEPSLHKYLPRRYQEAIDIRMKSIWQILFSTTYLMGYDSKLRISQELQLLKAEKATWQLLEKVCEHYNTRRKRDENRHSNQKKLEDLFKNNPFWKISYKEVAKLLFEIEDDLRVQQILIQWLELTADEEETKFPWEGSWDHTARMHFLTDQGKNLNGNIISAMDPDAPIREGKELAPTDKEKEEKISKVVWNFIRRGMIDEAQNYCRQCKQHWRAITLAGALYYHNARLISEQEEEEEENTIQICQENQNYFVYYDTLMKMTQEEKFSRIERSIYGALCGDRKRMLWKCNKFRENPWEDRLWAHLKANVEYRFTDELYSHLDKISDEYPCATSLREAQGKYYTSLRSLIDLMRANDNSIEKNYHNVQLDIILQDFGQASQNLITTVLNKKNTNYAFISQLVRFACHFALFISNIYGQTIDNQDEIIILYIDYLINTKQYEFVARYTYEIRSSDQQRSIYVNFLQKFEEIEHETYKDYKEKALKWAHEAGLNIESILNELIERRLNERAASASYYQNKYSSISTQDKKAIETLSWLLVDGFKQYNTLIKAANSLIRSFIRENKPEGTSNIFKTIPFKEISTYSTNNKEIKYWYLYVKALKSYNDWFGCFVEKENLKDAPRITVTDVSSQIEAQRFEKILKMRKEECEKQEEGQRNCAIKLLRKVLKEKQHLHNENAISDLNEKCIPNIVSLLYKIFFDTGQFANCVELADLVAKEKYKLYECFSKEDLRQLIIKIKEAELRILK